MLRTIAEDHHRLVGRGLIYLETGFLCDRLLSHKMARAAWLNPRLSFIVVVPSAPVTVAFDGSTGSDARYGEFFRQNALLSCAASLGSGSQSARPCDP